MGWLQIHSKRMLLSLLAVLLEEGPGSEDGWSVQKWCGHQNSSIKLLHYSSRFIRIAWTLVESKARQTSEAAELTWCFNSTWLDGHFPVRTWKYFNHNGPCTNNHVEGWHNPPYIMEWKARPNLIEFIEVIQKEQATAEVTIEHLTGAGRARAKIRKVVRHEETIKKLMEEFTGGVRRLESF